MAADHVDDVIAELASKADTALVASAPIDAVYIGGGTPSALPEDQMARLVRALHDYLPLAPDCEITMEGRSFGFAPSKAVAVADAGVTRLSIGVQSFASEVRRRLGRKLNGDDVKAFLAELVALDRTVVVCDLMYGLPGQSAEDWRRDIETVNDIGLDGVTLYALNVFPGGPLSRAIASGKLPAQASIAVQARAYADAVDRLEAYGWLQALAVAHGEVTARAQSLQFLNQARCAVPAVWAGRRRPGSWLSLAQRHQCRGAPADAGRAPCAGRGLGAGADASPRACRHRCRARGRAARSRRGRSAASRVRRRRGAAARQLD
ncbi:MAG: radical SAM protein [Rhodopseudomonas palustris]|nr:radical SAM protein [Rhodopseudomonas palustris]